MPATAQDKRIIEAAYQKLFILNNYTWNPYRDEVYKMSRASERQHRSSQKGRKHGCTIALAAKYFTVKYILEGALEQAEQAEPIKIKMESLLHCREEYLRGKAAGARYSTDVLSCFTDYDIELLLELDYVQLIS